MLQIRPEQEQDIKQIDLLLNEAFADTSYNRKKEYLCVNILRRINALPLALVAELHDQIIGYLATIPLTVNDRPSSWIALFPLAIHPKRQQQDIATKLVDAALEYLSTQPVDGCISIGAPDFYENLGFMRSPLISVEAVANSQFLIYQLKRPISIGLVKLHTAFTSLAK